MSNFTYGVITVSDRCHLGQAEDTSGPSIKINIQQSYGAIKISNCTVPDEQDKIEDILKYYSDDLNLHCIFTTGGTGFAPRDVTPEATRNVIHKECPQLALAMALESFEKTRFAALSRAICGIRGTSLIINMPGSKKAVDECFAAIKDVLPHAIELIRDEKSKTEITHKEIQNNKFVNKVAPILIDSIEVQTPQNPEMIETPPKQENVPVEPTKTALISTETSNPNLSIKSEILLMSENIERTTMSEIIIDDSQLNLSSIKFDSPEKKRSNDQKLKNVIEADYSKIKQPKPDHVCPHKTAKAGDKSDRNSIYPMVEVENALEIIYSKINRPSGPEEIRSKMNCPPFRASIKDGYAVKSISTAKKRTVIGYVSAGEPLIKKNFPDDHCFKINTGAPVPDFADAVIQIEDTILVSQNSDGMETEISVLKFPSKKLDIRDIGSDLMLGEVLFQANGLLGVAEKTILASVGQSIDNKKPTIAIISTGDELIDPKSELKEGQIYDCNSTMLKMLLLQHNFEVKVIEIAKDDYNSLKTTVTKALNQCDVVISSGGVSMGDKDFVKGLLIELGFEINFGRVNMKPGKPMTFASNDTGKLYFALPGNPVSAYVTFHLFVLPALRYMCGISKQKCQLPVINTILQIDKYTLDSRPEYVRARITCSLKRGIFYSHMTSNQMSSRVSSLINADVLLHLPGATKNVSVISRGTKLKATVINQYFISEYKE